ncbi:MAG: peptide-methionine (S)-S-oxide reductase MsrA [Candidatus Marinimicrobia bacterium]|nr:peptide-methionine (S)-S-oxide reductase MsrA [Candidatus Neomarinimicrobiota bacterium]
MEIATLGAGCFWCVEAIFQSIPGVISIEPGYAGGEIENPTYEQVCGGNTGHAEVCQINFNNSVVTFSELLDVFWTTHDPTTLNRQGADSGTQYRSVIYYHSDAQREMAEASKKHADTHLGLDSRIVTEISPIANYSTAEDYHHNYFKNNPNAPYCEFVIRPKVEKFVKSRD